MGHQTTFFMTPKDMDDFQARLREKTDFVILLDQSPTSTPRIVENFNVIENGEPWYFLFLARPEDVDAIVMRHVPEQKYWLLQCDESPVLEFSTGPFTDNTLQDGRIYYVDRFWMPEDTWIEKSEAFRKWAKMVHATLKKFLKRRPAPSLYYIGPDAQTWLDAGKGHLINGFGKRVD